MNPKLLIVDDDEDIRSQLKWALCQAYEVVLAEDRRSCLDAFKTEHPGVVLLDLGLPPNPGGPEEGLTALGEILSLDNLVKVIILSGQSEKENALRAIGQGAYDFLTKPPEIEELKVVLKRAFHLGTLEREFRQVQQQLETASF